MDAPTNGIATNNGTNQINTPWSIGPREFILKNLKYLPWILICIAIALILAYIRIRYTTPTFIVQSSLLIKNDRNSAGQGGDDARFNEMFLNQQSVNLDNEIQILKSSPVMERVVTDLNFQIHYFTRGSIRSSLMYPESPFYLKILHIADSSKGFGFSIKIIDDNQFLIGLSKSPVAFGQGFEINGNSCILFRNKMIGLGIYPPDLKFSITWAPASSIAGSLLGGLKIKHDDEQSTILDLSYTGENVSLSKDVLNTLMAVYDTLIVEDKSKTINNTLSFIKSSLDTLIIQLSGSEKDIKGFMARNDVVDITEQSKNYLDRLSEGAKDIRDLDVKIGLADQMIQYISNANNQYKMVPLNLGIEEPILVKLVNEYNTYQSFREGHLKTTPENNPLIVSTEVQLEKARHDILEVLKQEKQGYTLALNNLTQKNAEVQGQIKTLPGKSLGLVSIQRQQKILEDLYSFLLQKRFETNISSAATVSNSKVIEPAAGSLTPVKPDKKSIYSLFTLFGLIIPLIIIIARELMRDKVNGRADVEKQTRAPILGEIGHSRENNNLVVRKNSRRFIAEQFRIIRSNLQYIIARKENPVIMVTSSFSGEGKSFISTNMGAVMALAGKKTVIMEFDIRKPKIATGLELKRKMGITNYIIGNVKFEDLLLQVDGFENLYVIPCGPVPPNPAELLLDSKLEELITEVKKHFEVIIMDTAPVGLVSDAINLGRFVDCTLYIIRQEHTFKKQLKFIEELYTEQKIPAISLIINDVGTTGGYYGGYGYGYGSGYGYGYGYGYGSGYFEDDAPKKTNTLTKVKRLWKRWLN